MCYRLYHRFIASLEPTIKDKIEYYEGQYRDANAIWYSNEVAYRYEHRFFHSIFFLVHTVLWCHRSEWNRRQIEFWKKEIVKKQK